MKRFFVCLFLSLLLNLCLTALSGCRNPASHPETAGIPSSDSIKTADKMRAAKIDSLQPEPAPDSTGTTTYFPFQASESDGKFVIVAELESKELYPKYYNLFKRHGYEGNGPCWEGHIRQILEQKDKELLDHLEFDPEAGLLAIYADSKASQLEFVKVMSPIFADTKILDGWIKKADRSKIDD
jgi:hypothetical protein